MQISYIPFARKYRPSNFKQLHGQEFLTKILTYCILNNRLAHGYLLTGIRGVGKTTSARIIAKTVNCQNPVGDQDNIAPCEQCNNCISFNEQKHPDIIEIDAASKTSVDEIRLIINSSEYRPLLGKYKIFIIDEVHMLSKGAFNALLKVLEEPPPHIIFIFATTEVHKIPLTVISRCQRYDLRRLTFTEITTLLQEIAQKENLVIEENALKLLAIKSDGSARDAVSMLDQAASFVSSAQIMHFLEPSQSLITTNTNSSHDKLNKKIIISLDMVSSMLGIAGHNVVVEFFSYLVAADIVQALELVNKIYQSGANLEHFVESLCDFTVYLSKRNMIPDYHDHIYSSFSSEINQMLSQISFTQISLLWQILNKAISEVKEASNQLIVVEMLVMKLIYSRKLPNFEIGSNEPPLNLDSPAQQKTETSTKSSITAEQSYQTVPTESLKTSLVRLGPSEAQSRTTTAATEVFSSAVSTHSPIVPSPAVPSINIKTNSGLVAKAVSDLFNPEFVSFLKYLCNQNEMHLYHLLSKEVEVKKFTSNFLEIAGSDITPKTRDLLANALFAWTDQTWNVIITKQSEVLTLNDQLANSLKSSPDWKLIEEHFSESKISDILLQI